MNEIDELLEESDVEVVAILRGADGITIDTDLEYDAALSLIVQGLLWLSGGSR